MSRRTISKLCLSVLCVTGLVATVIVVGGAGPESRVAVARADSCAPFGSGTEAGIYAYSRNSCVGGGNFYTVCLEGASQTSGWSAPFACSGPQTPGALGQLMFSGRANRTTSVFYRAAIGVNGGSPDNYHSAAGGPYC
jgi:hypothetical protein